MLSKKHISKSSVWEDHHLYIVAAHNGRNSATTTDSTTAPPPDLVVIRQLTCAMMNRLGIPCSTTIVGLLGVGLSYSNYDELSKWIASQIATLPTGSMGDHLPLLEKRFFRAVDRFPKL